jgi:hypothetical protein
MKAKKGRFEIISKHRTLLLSNVGKPWKEIRLNPEVQSMLTEAREIMQLSPKTVNYDIYASLTRGATR